MRTWIWSATHTSPRPREGTCLKKERRRSKEKGSQYQLLALHTCAHTWTHRHARHIHVHTHEHTDTHSTYLIFNKSKILFHFKENSFEICCLLFKKIPYFLYYLINKISNEEKQKWEPESWPADCDAPWFTNRDESYSPQEKQFSLNAENMQTCQTGPLFHQDFYFLSV